MTIRAVLLDLGDTLISGNITSGDTETIWEEVYCTLINPCHDSSIPSLPTIRAAIKEHVHNQMAQVWKYKIEKEQDALEMYNIAFAATGFEVDTCFIHRVLELEHKLLYRHLVRVGPTVFSTLQLLRERGYLLGLCSNFCNLTEVVYESLREVKLLEQFDQTAVSCEVGWRKPSPRIYAAICERLAVAPEECLFVGDRLIEDVKGPQEYGMRAILTHEFRQEDPTPEIQPFAVITRLDQLLAQLEE
ncbi:MAG: HAD family hydrolase [Chloroflexi bacterium]|uniref:HAD family hydrolase n=1 Tax=Candidatus Chlorohelix allophototropha TaxID=3003348 RepID=A0A8T7M0Z1_9CHLR|nr:HAD family hydrolase [Chloroflexota bacterium]WJW67041.1 HAD family hydrolase [Chloroflexota bacterium L227-S17]